jgi:sigma-B regulation protein RsbU (phosphoserine phosphatase)
MFLSVFYGVIDPAAGVLTYSNAGHPHAFVIREDGEVERLMATDPPVGFAGPDSYGEDAVAWQGERDLLLLFTDGLSDTLPTRGLKNGETQILDEAVQARFSSTREIIDALFALAPDAYRSALADDRTALVVRL